MSRDNILKKATPKNVSTITLFFLKSKYLTVKFPIFIILNWNLETGCVAYIWYVIAVLCLWDNFFLVAVLIHWHRAPAMFYPTKFIDRELWLYNLLWYSFPCIFSCPGQLNRWHCQWVSQWHFDFSLQSLQSLQSIVTLVTLQSHNDFRDSDLG